MKQILLKPTVILIFLVCVWPGLIAQKSGYFTYDRESVSLAMAEINEDHSPASLPGLLLRDTVRPPAGSTWSYYLLGIVTGAAGCTAGTLLPFILKADYAFRNSYLPIISGIFLGFILPSAMVGIFTGNTDKTISTGMGNLTGFAVIIEGVILYFIFSFAGNIS